MSAHDQDDHPSRRKVLECMTWAGTGVLWTVAGGVPASLGIVDEALAAEQKGFTFLQISDSHMGFDKPANPNAKGTLEEAIEQVKALPEKPAFMIHTGDISHLSKAAEFDDADRIISQSPARCALRAGRARLHRSGAEALPRALRPRHQGRRLVLVRRQRRAFHRPGQRRRPEGAAALAIWDRAARMARRRCQRPLGLAAHRGVRAYPAMDGLSAMGLGHGRRRQGARLSQALRLGHRAQRPHPPGDAEGRGQRHLPHRALDRLSAAGARHAPNRPGR